jgi:hypothetical protein
MLTVILDIETAPIDGVDAYLPDVRHNKGTKDAEKQAAQVAEKRQALLDDAGLDPDLSRIVCLGVDSGFGPQSTLCRDENMEHIALTGFWELVRSARGDFRIVGFNCLAFDLPRLYRRSLYLDVPPVPMMRDKFRHPNVVDLCDLLSEGGRLTMRSLDYYCSRFKLSVPIDYHHGAEMPALVAEGRWAEVEEHNRCDLVKTTALARRLGVLNSAPVAAPRRLTELDIVNQAF